MAVRQSHCAKPYAGTGTMRVCWTMVARSAFASAGSMRLACVRPRSSKRTDGAPLASHKSTSRGNFHQHVNQTGIARSSLSSTDSPQVVRPSLESERL